MPVTALNAFAQSSAERLVNSAVEGVVLALLAWLILQLAPRQNAGTRFSIWMATLLSIASLPFAEAFARVDRPIATAVSHATLTVPAAWGIALFAAWALIATFLLARLAFGLAQLFRLRASGEEVELASLPELPRQTLIDFQAHRRVALCVSERVSVPTAVGLFRPAVMLPSWALSELSAADLNSVLVHELAHLRRRDDWSNLLQKLVRAVFFFHPAVWWIEKRLSLEREMACDEHVLASTEDPHAYAECLVSLAEKGFLHRAAILAQGAVHRVQECSARVRQILASGSPRSAGASRVALVSAASGSVLLLATFAQAPNLIAFSSPSQSNVIAAENTPTPDPAITPAAWYPASHAPVVTPAAYVEPHSTDKKTGKHGSSSVNHAPAVKSTLQHVTRNSVAPNLYRAGFRQPQASDPAAAFIIVKQTDFYSDGARVWAVSTYRMTVFRPQPAIQNDTSRTAI
jgi:beta-lactamase regulating signal transducer with metallopeptidase domain